MERIEAEKDIPSTYVSIIIPVFNEEDNLEELYKRLKTTMESYGKPYEILFVDDGSRDRSWEILEKIYREAKGRVRLIQFNRNYGQHLAIFAGMERVHGEIVVTLDADLQNFPEDIPLLVERIQEGHDVVGGWRENRKDSWLRTIPSYLVNLITSKVIGVKLKDYGCMLRAYRREIVEHMTMCQETSSFIPALANTFARSVDEIPVRHTKRSKGRSKYNLFKLIKLNFDLMTGFSLVPIQAVSFLGVLVAFLGLGFGAFLFIRRLLIGPEVEGVFTLFAILFVFIGLQILGMGLLGEYIGRIYREVRRRPRFIIRKELN